MNGASPTTHAERIEYVFNTELLANSPCLRACNPVKTGEKPALTWKQYGGNIRDADSDETIKQAARVMASVIEKHLWGRAGDVFSMTPEYRVGLVCIGDRKLIDTPIIFSVLAQVPDMASGLIFFLGAQFSKDVNANG